MNLLYLLLSLLYQFFNNLLLLSYHCGEFGINDFSIELAVHQSCSLVIFDVTLIHRSRQFYVLAETLLLEVTNSVLVGKSQEMQYIVFYVIILEHVHEVRAVPFDLFLTGHSAEDDLREALSGEHSKANSTDRSPVFDESECFVLRIEYQL